MTDLWLAIAHHVLVFGLAIMLAVEATMLRDGMSGGEAVKLARLDLGYGINAALIIIVGVHRVFFGLKGYEYYAPNVWFWAKMATFALIGILSIPPTLQFRAWQKAAKGNAGFSPPAEEIHRARGYVRLELRLLILVVAFAAAMARYTTF